jgi:hypothetical protein
MIIKHHQEEARSWQFQIEQKRKFIEDGPIKRNITVPNKNIKRK